MIRSTDSLRFYSSLSTGAIVGIVVPAVVAVLAVVAALFYRFKFKSVEKAYNQLYNIHTDTTQQQTDVPVAFSTSLIGNNTAPASRVGVRNVAPSAQSFGHDLQPSHTGSPAPFPISSVSETDTRGIAVPSDQSRVIYDFLCILLYSANILLNSHPHAGVLEKDSQRGRRCPLASLQVKMKIMETVITPGVVPFPCRTFRPIIHKWLVLGDSGQHHD